MWDVADLEGIARDVLEETGCDDPPVDAFELAELMGFEVHWSPRAGARTIGRRIYVHSRSSVRRQHGLIAHELGHAAAERGGLDGRDEPAACFLGGALLVPRAALRRDLREGLDLERLYARHQHASLEMIARRVTQVTHAGGRIWDHGHLTRHFGEELALDIDAARTAQCASTSTMELPGRVVCVSLLTAR